MVVNDLGGDTRGEGSSSDAAQAVVDAITSRGGTATAVAASVATPEGAAAMVEHAVASYGRLDVVVNNAGIVPNRQGVADLTPEEWQRMLDVNLVGTVNVLRATWPHLLESPAGRVVNTSSATVVGAAGALTYGTAKAGIIGLTRTLALDAADTRIKVNAVWPFGSSRMSSTTFAAMFEEQYAMAPGSFNETFTAEAVAEGVVALCHESVPCTGEVLVVGGGRMARVLLGTNRGAWGAQAEDFARQWDDVLAPAHLDIPAHSLDVEEANIADDRISWAAVVPAERSPA